MIKIAAILALLALPGRAAADALALPRDGRLEPVRAELQATLDQATAHGLPAQALLNKIQEGLAKNAPAPAILQVTRTLLSDYVQAQKLLAQLGPERAALAGSPALLRALVDAKTSGVSLQVVRPLLTISRTGAAPPPTDQGRVRAVQVLADLAVRGYPVDHAVQVVSYVLARDPRSLPAMVADLDRVRRAHGLSQAETLDAVQVELEASGGKGDGSLDHAVHKVDEGGGHGQGQGPPPDHGRGPQRDTSGSHGNGNMNGKGH